MTHKNSIYFILTLILLTIDNILYSQNLEEILKSSKKYSDTFIELIEENKFQEAKNIIVEWEKIKGLTEPVFRAKILIDFKENKLKIPEDWQYFHNNMIKYIERITNKSSKNTLEYNGEKYVEFIKLNSEFDKFTIDFASKIIEKYDTNTIEFIICELYTNKTYEKFYKKIKQYESSEVHDSYIEIIEQQKKSFELRLLGSIGLCAPMGKLSNTGFDSSFELTIASLNYKSNIVQFNIVRLRNENSTDSIFFKFDNENYRAKFVAPLSIGLSYGRNVLYYKKNEINILAGFSYQFYDISFNDENIYTDGHFETISANFSTEYFYHWHNFLLGTKIRCNFVNYSNSMFNGYKGGYFEFLLTGGISFSNKYRKLKILEY